MSKSESCALQSYKFVLKIQPIINIHKPGLRAQYVNICNTIALNSEITDLCHVYI